MDGVGARRVVFVDEELGGGGLGCVEGVGGGAAREGDPLIGYGGGSAGVGVLVGSAMSGMRGAVRFGLELVELGSCWWGCKGGPGREAEGKG